MRVSSPEEKCRRLRRSLGSSEIAAVLGLSPYQDRWELWAEKTGLIGPRPVDERMRWGTHLQRAIAEAFAERMGMAIDWWDKPVLHPQRKWQRASPDAFVCEPGGIGKAILEVKNISLDQAGEWSREFSDEDGVPDYYAVQAHWQMSACQLATCWIAALIAGNDLRVYRLEYDAQVERDLVRAGEKFWFGHVVANRPPPMGPSRAARSWLGSRYPRQTGELRRAEGQEIKWLEEYARVRADLAPLEELKETLENDLKKAIGDAEGLTWERGKLTWKRSKDSAAIEWEDLAQELLANYGLEEREGYIQRHTSHVDGTRRIHFTVRETR